MPPEHLNALAHGGPEGVDGRGDIYGLGVVLFESLTGKRPFASPRRGGGMVDLLNRAALDRLRRLPRLPSRSTPGDPWTPLETVIRRCLEPEPADRYERASFLAADLQAVADDLPLPHTREAWPRRTAAWIRRRRGRISAITTLAVVISALLAGLIGLRVERTNLLHQATLEADMGQEALDRGDYSAAKARFDAAASVAERSSQTPWSYLVKFNDFRQIGGQLRSKYREFKSAETPEEMRALALEKSKLAERTGLVHQKADLLFQAADHLRFRLLLDEGSELTEATLDLQKVLAPFFVLENPNWTQLPHTMALLDADRQLRLVSNVNELLFLWMAAIDESAVDSPQLRLAAGSNDGKDLLAPALTLCDRALVWVNPPAPWVALSARLRASQAAASTRVPVEGNPDASSVLDEPREVTQVDSPLACFQWGVLAYRADRLSPTPSNGSSVPPGWMATNTTGINSCSVISKTRPVTPTTPSGITVSPRHYGLIRRGSSSAWLESTACGANGTGPAKTSPPPYGSSKAGPRLPRSGWNWPTSTSRWAISPGRAACMI